MGGSVEGGHAGAGGRRVEGADGVEDSPSQPAGVGPPSSHRRDRACPVPTNLPSGVGLKGIREKTFGGGVYGRAEMTWCRVRGHPTAPDFPFPLSLRGNTMQHLLRQHSFRRMLHPGLLLAALTLLALAPTVAAQDLLHELASPDQDRFGSFGYSVAGVPDADGDGRSDLLVGAPGDGPLSPGRAYLVSGVNGALLYELVSPNEQFDGNFGYSVAGIPDADGDGARRPPRRGHPRGARHEPRPRRPGLPLQWCHRRAPL